MKHPFSLLLLAAAVLGACSSAPQYQTTRQRDIDALTKAASFEMPKVKVPSFPDRTYNVLDYGADPTGAVLATEAIQKAIDECTEAGGGTVVIPAGIYTTAPLTLKSNVRLYTEKNSFIIFSHDLDLYDIYDEWFEGIPTKRCTSPLNARGAENIAITGHGTFNGNGYIISNMKIGTSSSRNTLYLYKGLFGYTSNAVINCVGVTGAQIYGNGPTDYRCGALVGQADGGSGKIYQCFVKNSTVNMSGTGVSGVIVGDIRHNLTDCYTLNSSATGTRAGTVVGDMKSTLYNVYSGANCSSTTNSYTSENKGTPVNCYNKASASASAGYVNTFNGYANRTNYTQSAGAWITDIYGVNTNRRRIRLSQMGAPLYHHLQRQFRHGERLHHQRALSVYGHHAHGLPHGLYL